MTALPTAYDICSDPARGDLVCHCGHRINSPDREDQLDRAATHVRYAHHEEPTPENVTAHFRIVNAPDTRPSLRISAFTREIPRPVVVADRRDDESEASSDQLDLALALRRTLLR